MSSIKKKVRKAPKDKRAKSQIYGHNIVEVMEEKGIIAAELAELIETSPPHMSKILNGSRKCISLPMAMKIARALNTPVEELFILDKPKDK